MLEKSEDPSIRVFDNMTFVVSFCDFPIFPKFGVRAIFIRDVHNELITLGHMVGITQFFHIYFVFLSSLSFSDVPPPDFLTSLYLFFNPFAQTWERGRPLVMNAD